MGDTELRFEGADRKVFDDAVRFAIKAIDARPHKPADALTRFVISDEQLVISATSAEQTRWTTVPVPGAPDAAFAVAGTLMGNLLRTLPDGPLTVTVGSKMELRTGRLRFGLRTQDVPDDQIVRPADADADAITVAGSVLARAATKAAKCADSKQDSPLSGVHASCDGSSLTLAATDRHRLIAVDVDIIGGTETSALLASNVLLSIASDAASFDEVKVELTDDFARFSFGDHVVVSRLVEMNFPAYQKVFDQHVGNTSVRIEDRKLLVDQIKRLQLVGEGFENGVIVELTATPEDGISVEAAQRDGNDGDGTFDGYPVVGPAQTLKFMSGFVATGLELADGPVNLTVQASDKPFLFDGGTVDGLRYRYMAMPVR